MNGTQRRFKIGDWVEVISHDYNNLLEEGYNKGVIFQVTKCDEVSGDGSQWLVPSGQGIWGVNSKSVRCAKNKIVKGIINDL